MKLSTLSLALMLSLSVAAVAQDAAPPPPAPPKPMAKPTPAEVSEKTEEQFAAEIVKSLEKPVSWKQQIFPDFRIKVDMPRAPVRQTESFYDDALGNAKVMLYFSVSDDATYAIARTQMPYSISDEKLLRESYREVLSGLSGESGDKYQHVRDFVFDGRLGVEMNSVPQDAAYQRARAWTFLVGRDMYILFAQPNEDPETDDPPDAKLITSRGSAFDKFFASIVKVEEVSKPAFESPALVGEWKGEVYRSLYFDFSFKTPSKWIRLSEDDVEGVRKWGKDVVSANSGVNVPADRIPRRNLASFVSAPLGNSFVAMISVNLGIPGKSFEDVKLLGDATETALKRFATYEIVRRPHEAKLGEIPAISMTNKIRLPDGVQNQQIYYFLRKGYVLAVTITCYKTEDCTTAATSLSSIKFEEKAP